MSYEQTHPSVKVEKVENGYVLRPGTHKPVVVEGLGTKKLAEALAKLFGTKED